MTFPGLRSMGCRKTKPAEVSGGLSWLRLSRIPDRLFFHCATDVDDVVGDESETDLTVHSGIAFVAAAIDPVSPLAHADASLASGPPFLSVAEPALPLLSFALGALGRMVGNADALDALGFRCCLVLGGVECGICCHHVRRTRQHCSMHLDGGYQQVRIARTPIIDLVVDHDLVLGLLQLHHLAELVPLAGLALANDLRR